MLSPRPGGREVLVQRQVRGAEAGPAQARLVLPTGCNEAPARPTSPHEQTAKCTDTCDQIHTCDTIKAWHLPKSHRLHVADPTSRRLTGLGYSGQREGRVWVTGIGRNYPKNLPNAHLAGQGRRTQFMPQSVEKSPVHTALLCSSVPITLPHTMTCSISHL